jgi:predicted DNA-binding ribbon-helix-helix protein
MTDPTAPEPSSPHATLVASRPVKRSFAIRGHKTSISLESAFWDALKEIARGRNQSLADVVSAVDDSRGTAGLSGAVRIFILDHYRGKQTGN